ncbi:zinc finger protein 398-like isoform X2 [Ambystoma mexicanum]|uniref:zinc finger protein 398-like isoform X2 n=1 Tax=Ambystoma mexicanum TaxID=8296 RepID=UPI0037E8C46E
MSWRDPDKVSFHDTSACFSEEEWKLLQEWQKELYRNVMKEIHHALISLGPLIATTVYSLRTKEKEELCSLDCQELEKRHGSNDFPSGTVPNGDELFIINREDNLHMANHQDTSGRERNYCVSRDEEPIIILIDHLDEDGEESSMDPSPGDPVFTSVKLEDESYFHNGAVPMAKTTSGKYRNRKRKVGYMVADAENTTAGEDLQGEDAVLEVLASAEKGTDSRSQLWSGKARELEEQTTESETAPMHPQYLKLRQGTSNTTVPDKRNDFWSNLWNADLLASQPDSQISIRPRAWPESETSFHMKPEHSTNTHQRPLLGERQYPCTVCEKSFLRKQHLLQHERIHTGERPYQCTKCDKRFSLKGNLNKHQKTHLSKSARYHSAQLPHHSETPESGQQG